MEIIKSSSARDNKESEPGCNQPSLKIIFRILRGARYPAGFKVL